MEHKPQDKGVEQQAQERGEGHRGCNVGAWCALLQALPAAGPWHRLLFEVGHKEHDRMGNCPPHCVVAWNQVLLT